MCIILDANRWGEFLSNKSEMEPVHKWIGVSGKGKIVFSDYEKIKKEIESYLKKYFKNISPTRSLDYLRELHRSGKIKLICKSRVEESIREIENCNTLKSNDTHILALAKASKTKLLCSSDKDLHSDFKKIIKGGNVYQNKKHKNLLKENICS